MNEETHKAFLSGLDGSQDAVLFVARYLTRRGLTVQLPPFDDHAATPEERAAYRDGGDLFVLGDVGDPYALRRFEVKELTTDFTDAASYRFENVLVCQTAKFDLADPKPEGIFLLNPAWTHAAYVSAKYRGDWWIETKKPKNHPGEQKFYFCRKDQVTFIPLGV